MKIPTSIRDFFSLESAPGKSWPSIVLLLHHAKNLSAENISQLADAAWGMTGPEGRTSPKVIEANDRSFILQLAPTIFLSFHQISARYELSPQPDQSANDAITRMWQEHRAWCSVDAPGRYDLPDKERQGCYKLLFHLVAKVWDSNVCGLYLPSENAASRPVIPPYIPNHGDLIGSMKWAAANLSKTYQAAAAQSEHSSGANS